MSWCCWLILQMAHNGGEQQLFSHSRPLCRFYSVEAGGWSERGGCNSDSRKRVGKPTGFCTGQGETQAAVRGWDGVGDYPCGQADGINTSRPTSKNLPCDGETGGQSMAAKVGGGRGRDRLALILQGDARADKKARGRRSSGWCFAPGERRREKLDCTGRCAEAGEWRERGRRAI